MLLTVCWSLSITDHLSVTNYCLLYVGHYLLLSVCWSLSVAQCLGHYLLLTLSLDHYLLLTISRSPSNAHSIFWSILLVISFSPIFGHCLLLSLFHDHYLLPILYCLPFTISCSHRLSLTISWPLFITYSVIWTLSITHSFSLTISCNLSLDHQPIAYSLNQSVVHFSCLSLSSSLSVTIYWSLSVVHWPLAHFAYFFSLILPLTQSVSWSIMSFAHCHSYCLSSTVNRSQSLAPPCQSLSIAQLLLLLGPSLTLYSHTDALFVFSHIYYIHTLLHTTITFFLSLSVTHTCTHAAR